jgi:hypothetical protein
MGLKLVFVAVTILALAALAAPGSEVFAQAGFTRGAAPMLSALAHPAGIERRTDAQRQSEDDERRLSPGPVIGLICAIAASSVALGVAFGLRRRIDRIAGPDPNREDDD